MPYQVSTPVFEGPFDLLLHLITREQVDLWEVSLSSIVDEYVATLEQMRSAGGASGQHSPGGASGQHGLDLDVATEFLLIAAVLLELKARRLLPGRDEVEMDDELGIWEERDLLLARLLEAKTFKDAAGALGRLMDSAGRSAPRTAGLEERFLGLMPDLLAGVTAEQLRDALGAALAPKPAARVLLDHVAPVRVSVADAVVELRVELDRLGRASFRRLTAGITERLAVIVRFLAVLELYKQGAVDLDQPTTFADLQVTWLGDADETTAPATVEEYAG